MRPSETDKECRRLDRCIAENCERMIRCEPPLENLAAAVEKKLNQIRERLTKSVRK